MTITRQRHITQGSASCFKLGKTLLLVFFLIMHKLNSRVTYKATTAPLLSPALHNISLIADVRALVLSREEG